jgi:hypothetical protein
VGRWDTLQATVFDSFLKKLRTSLSLSTSQCYPTLDPSQPVIPPGGDYWLSVAPGDSTFPPGEQVPTNITEEWSLIVTIYNRMRLDPAGRDTALLTDPTRGLWALKRQVMAALVGEDLVDVGGAAFLRQLVFITRASRGEIIQQDAKGIAVATMHLEFGVSFDWDLVT